MLLVELPRAPKAPAGGASIAIEYGEPIEPRKFGYDVMSVRPYVRPYARIRPGDEFAFVLYLDTKTYRFYLVRLELSYLS